ncbi:MAG: DUF4105 domain-containing protein [Gammaproteobacteria bacterium]|nr:DUF4105 domain-containing protein [Gammaproteobacteria bacterium]
MLLLYLQPAAARADAVGVPSVDYLWTQAADKQLYKAAEWLALLHYHDESFGGPESYVDDKAFFLAADGGDDAAAELRATLNLFVNTPETRCRFPARYNWLSRQLDFSKLKISKAECPEYEDWRNALNASSIVLVFAASYVNSPSSMYGHTFLRFDPPDIDQSSPLLSYALNFGANVTGSEAGLLYAWRGIAGGYPGHFSSGTYIEKTKKYSRLENRDLWEYRLALTPAEVDQMLAHVWELNEISFDYYFFDENCSFRLLELIEVARPDLDITSGFDAWAIPLDTVRVVEKAGLIDDVYYRPSNQSVVTYNIGLLNKSQQMLALTLSQDIQVLHEAEFLELGESDQAQVAYTAYKFLRYEYNEDERDPGIAERSYKLLTFLASRKLRPPEQRVPPTPISPLDGHATMMASAGAGVEDDKWYSDIELRLSYHDLLDNLAGFPRDTSLNMGRFILRYRENDGLQLQRLDILEITSVPPRDHFYKPLSWQTSLGFDRQWTNGDDELTFQGNGGVGLSYKTVFDGRIVTMLRGRAEYNDGFNDGKVDVAAGGSIAYLRQGVVGNTMLLAETLHFVGGTDRQLLEIRQNFVLTRNNAIRLHFKRSIDESSGINEAGLYYRVYF